MKWAGKVKQDMQDKEKRWEIGLLGFCLLFYLIFPFLDGPVWCVDSNSYAAMDITREPLYPTFLWVFRRMFGEGNYLMPVVAVQSVLGAYAAWKLAVTVKEYKEGSRILAVLAVCFQIGVVLLNRFVAKRGSSYTVSIMTEGMGFPLYVLFIVQLYKYMMEKRARNLAGTAVLAVLLVSLRKQMLLTLCLMAVVFILYFLIKKREGKKLLGLLLLTALLLLTGKGADRLYNYLVRGQWVEHAGNSMGVLCTLIYTSGEADDRLFQDETLKRFYTEINRQAGEAGCKISYAPKDSMGLMTHYADSYDVIGYGMINPVVQGYIREHGDGDPVHAALQYDEYCGGMVKTLLGQEKGNLIRVVLANIGEGFVNSVARVHRVLNVYAVLAYLLYMGLYFRGICVRKSWGKPEATQTFAEIVLLGGSDPA